VKVAIVNVGKLVSGDIERPLLDADAILIENGKIARVGKEREVITERCDVVIDVKGMVVAPGLIDSHAHVAIGDFTPRQMTVGYIESSMHGGVTTMISAGEVHVPGRPTDPSGVKALAILAAKAYSKFRPGGVKVYGGGLILEPGLTEKDFEEMAREGVKHTGEIGLGRVKIPDEAAQMVRWARKYGIKSMMHTGGTSLPEVPVISADDIIEVNPDVAAHINGGPTAPSLDDVKKLITKSEVGLELVQCGNLKVMIEAVKMARGEGALHRVILGNDAPSGTGVIPLGILRSISQLSSLANIPPEVAIAMATGNTARIYGLNCGVIEEGRDADLIVMDKPIGSVGGDALRALSVGDIPGIAMVMIDGEVRALISRNTPPPARRCEVRRAT
jgi:enamidase